MATLSELVDTLAQVEGIDRATVGLIARTVREAGLITTGGRGSSAANMTFADAANLLIAVNASAIVRQAPDAVRTYRRLKATSSEGTKLVGTFGDALEQLIKAHATNGKLPKDYLSAVMPALIWQRPISNIWLRFTRPWPSAWLNISVRKPSDKGFIEAHYLELSNVPARDLNRVTLVGFSFQLPHKLLTRYSGDRKDETVIGYATLRAVSSLLGASA